VEEIVLNKTTDYIEIPKFLEKFEYHSIVKIIMSYKVKNIEACIDVAEKARDISSVIMVVEFYKTMGNFYIGDDKNSQWLLNLACGVFFDIS